MGFYLLMLPRNGFTLFKFHLCTIHHLLEQNCFYCMQDRQFCFHMTSIQHLMDTLLVRKILCMSLHLFVLIQMASLHAGIISALWIPWSRIIFVTCKMSIFVSTCLLSNLLQDMFLPIKKVFCISFHLIVLIWMDSFHTHFISKSFLVWWK